MSYFGGKLKHRAIKFYSICLLGLLLVTLMNETPQVFGNEDWGKIFINIYDPLTGKPVQEVFKVEFFINTQPLPKIYTIIFTNNRGYYSGDMYTGEFNLVFSPASENSKYCFEPDYYVNPKYSFRVIIEKGKIVKIKKTATIGGALKIKLVDKNGRLINPRLEFNNDARIIIDVKSENFVFPFVISNLLSDETIEEKLIMNELYPDEYTVNVEFESLGFPRIEKKGIIIKAGETTETPIMVDLSDTTGVEGIVRDRNGVILKRARLNLSPSFLMSGSFICYTDSNGYYRLTGLPPGEFSIGVSLHDGPILPIDIPVEIKKGMVTRKDITLNWAPTD